MTLKELPVGKSGLITAVGGEGILRCRLLDMGLIPNTRVTVQKIAPMGDPMEIRLRSYELTLRMDDAAQIETLGAGSDFTLLQEEDNPVVDGRAVSRLQTPASDFITRNNRWLE